MNNSTTLARSALARSRMRRSNTMHNLATAIVIGGLTVLAAGQLLAQRSPSCTVSGVTEAGETFAVTRRTCEAAWRDTPAFRDAVAR